MKYVWIALIAYVTGQQVQAATTQPDQRGTVESKKPERPPVCEGGDGKPPRR